MGAVLAAAALSTAAASGVWSMRQADHTVASALDAENASAEVRAFYTGRGHRPLWLKEGRPDARAFQALQMIQDAEADNLDPQTYGAERLAALLKAGREGGPAALEAEIALSEGLAAYIRELRKPSAAHPMVFVAGATPPRSPSVRAVLEEAAAAEDLKALRRMNPLYDGLRDALTAERDPARQQLIRANLERARALPRDMGRRFVLVDAAAQRLWLYEDGRATESMKVIVGKPSTPTPVMAGKIQYAVFEPYWNVPVDLTQHSIAPEVLRRGGEALNSRQLEVLSDWSPSARPIDPAVVDWRAVAAGRTLLRVRQRPGNENMMGAVKFMLPNSLGIYLHDTPQRDLFLAAQRTFSSGCVRLEDAHRLARWLGLPPPARGGPPERRIDLPRPIPVYITYFTVSVEPGGLIVRQDLYGRDAALMAALRRPAQATA